MQFLVEKLMKDKTKNPKQKIFHKIAIGLDKTTSKLLDFLEISI